MLRAIRADLATGFGLLTRLPVGWLAEPGAAFRPGRASWCFPLVGAVVQGIVAATLRGGESLGLSPLLAASWACVCGVLVTGALHEDGLADTADGLGGGSTPERRLTIMRDSRIGSYGALAVAGLLLVRVCALSELSAHATWCGLPCIGALSRAAAACLAGMVPSARPDGLGRAMDGGGTGPARFLAAAAAETLVLCCLPVGLAVALSAATVGVLFGAAGCCRRLLGGQTGDTLGATVVITECCLLSLLAAWRI